MNRSKQTVNRAMKQMSMVGASRLDLFRHIGSPARQFYSNSTRTSNLNWQTSFFPKSRNCNHPFAANSLATFSSETPKRKTIKPPSDRQIKSEWIQLVNPSSTLNSTSGTPDDRSKNTNQLIAPALTRDVLSRLDLNKYTLVQVDSKSNPPICKIISKEVLNQKERIKNKQQKEQQKSNRHDNVMKEIQLKWTIDVHDLNHKLKTVQNCFEKGYKVQVVINPPYRHQHIDPSDKDELLAIVEEQLSAFGGELVKQQTEEGKLIMEWHPIKKDK